MVKYRFSIVERTSVWQAHNKRCVYCGEPIPYGDLDIDHILPESLMDNQDQLVNIKIDYGLDTDFSINSYYNWVPSHRLCNQRKGTRKLYKQTALFYLEIAKAKLPEIKKIEKRLLKDAERDEVLISLGIKIEKGFLSKDEVISFLHSVSQVRGEYFQEPIVMSFGLLIEDVIDSGSLPEDVPTDYPHLCDWLESELIDYLKSILSCSFSYTEASLRDGECLTVRLAFWQIDLSEMDRFASPWWTILEVAYFPEIYGISAQKHYT